MIAFFGMGLLGSNFVRALRRRGEDVHVWNRTRARADALAPAGARVFDDPAEAVRGAARIHLTLSDDAAVDAVLERAEPGIDEGAVIVDHTTTSPSGTRERVARWDARGRVFVHAPVFMGPQNAADGTGMMLVSGERARVGAVTPHLAAMTGKLLDLGERPDRAAAFKLLGNLFLMFVTSGLSDFFELARALDVEPETAASLFRHWNPGTSLDARIERMLGADFGKASWELSMARKDARIMSDEAARAGRALAVLPAIASRMDALVARGHGHDDWTVLAKDALS